MISLAQYFIWAATFSAIAIMVLPPQERVYDPVIYILYGVLWPITLPWTLYLILFTN